MNIKIVDILQKEVSRTEFLGLVGAGILSVVGVTALLKNLGDVNYDIEEYFKNIKENPILNCIVKKSNFKVVLRAFSSVIAPKNQVLFPLVFRAIVR